MSTEFAYSREMQIILMFFSLTINFALMYMIAKLLLRIYGENAGVRQKALFAFLTGTILQSVKVYVIYYLGGMESFTRVEHLLVTSPDPIVALLYCFLGIRILKLPYLRSVELMGHIYLYYSIINALNRLAGSIFFVQPDSAHFSYLLDAERHLFNLLLCVVLFYATWRLLDKNPELFISKASVFANPRKDLIIFFLKACMIYLCVVSVPILVPQLIIANLLICIILSLFFASTLLFKFYQHEKAASQVKEAHIHFLRRSVDDFRALKHDFNNILQTYNGFFAIGDLESCKRYHESLVNVTIQTGDAMDLIQKIVENPALISLLIEKQRYAEKMNVEMTVSVKCPVSDLPMEEIDLCRITACLLDNAIEAAETSERKRVILSIEQKNEDTRLIIITNSTPYLHSSAHVISGGSPSTKEGHQGIGLSSVRRIIGKNANCTFQMSYYNEEVTAYVELRSR